MKAIYKASNPIETTNRYKVTNGRVIMSYERVNNDMYGNPLYRVYPVNYSFKRLSRAYRNYKSKGYYLIQSYNIQSDLYELMEEANKFVSVELDNTLISEGGYKEVNVL